MNHYEKFRPTEVLIIPQKLSNAAYLFKVSRSAVDDLASDLAHSRRASAMSTAGDSAAITVGGDRPAHH
jgi:hypothetical protein